MGAKLAPGQANHHPSKSAFGLAMRHSTPAFEALEARVLLSGGWHDPGLLNRLISFTATAEDLDAYDLVADDSTYSNAGEWIVRLELDARRPTAVAAVGEFGLNAQLMKTLGRPDLALV